MIDSIVVGSMRTAKKFLGSPRLLAVLLAFVGLAGPALADPPGASPDDDRPVGSLPVMNAPPAPRFGSPAHARPHARLEDSRRLVVSVPVPRDGGQAFVVDAKGFTLAGPLPLPEGARRARIEIEGDLARQAGGVVVVDGARNAVFVPIRRGAPR